MADGEPERPAAPRRPGALSDRGDGRALERSPGAVPGGDLVVLRSNWDYHHHLDAFVGWLGALETAAIAVENPVSLVAWNLDKSAYLADLAGKGIPTPDTLVVPGAPAALAAAMDGRGWERAVVKPRVGASGHDVRLVTRTALAHGVEPADATLVLLQEFLPEVQTTGEVSCVFFDGEFSHAALKRPPAGEFRVNSRYGGTYAPAEAIQPSVIDQAAAVLRALPAPPLYARVDGVIRGDCFILMELEVNEPGLFLDLADRAAGRFADAILRRLSDPSR